MKTKKIHNIFYTILLSLSTLSNASAYNDNPFKPPGRFINIGFQTMYVDCLGENKPTIIIDVGIAASSASWYKIAKELSKNTRIYKGDRNVNQECMQERVTSAVRASMSLFTYVFAQLRRC